VKPIAIIGAGGFVGSRLIERSELLGTPPLVSIVRGWRSQGKLARFGLRTVRGDAKDPASLAPLLKGCGMAVNLTMGDDKRIVGDVRSIYAACVDAGVPVFVHISSAEVFGRAEQAGLTEDSVPDGEHWMEYGREKAAAEAWLREQADGPVKTVILRPGLIWGPGAGWLVQPAQALIDGTAFLFNEGRGICNLIHVDNLIEHLLELARSDDVESGVYPGPEHSFED
jgi:nucleoside-diphosphate-sugar epimerase